jgi:hypothetical protein
MREVKHLYRILSENIKVRDHLGDEDVEGRIILKWILQKYYEVDSTGLE